MHSCTKMVRQTLLMPGSVQIAKIQAIQFGKFRRQNTINRFARGTLQIYITK